MSFYDRPDMRELLEAVREYITAEVAPAAGDRRARFRALIAANVLAIVEREMAQSANAGANDAARLAAFDLSGETPGERRRDLVRRIRAGDYDANPQRERAIGYAKATVAAKLEVSNPKFLRDYRN